MITLVRRIRKKLIESGAVTKYLLYALGEILLVVIGILIALQVNNWNEQRILAQKEKKILQEIRNDIDETNSEIVNDIAGHLMMLARAQQLKDHIKDADPDIERLSNYFLQISHDLQIYPKTSGFETLKSQGLEMISNDALRTNISNLYQLDYTRLTQFGRLSPENSIIELLKPYTLKHLRVSDESVRSFEYDVIETTIQRNRFELKSISNLRDDEEFFVILENSMRLRRYKIEIHETALKNGAGILELIESELDPEYDLNSSEKVNPKEVLIGKWQNTERPDMTTTISKQGEQLIGTSNVDDTPIKLFVLSNNRLWSSNGLYLKIIQSVDGYQIHTNYGNLIKVSD